MAPGQFVILVGDRPLIRTQPRVDAVALNISSDRFGKRRYVVVPLSHWMLAGETDTIEERCWGRNAVALSSWCNIIIENGFRLDIRDLNFII